MEGGVWTALQFLVFPVGTEGAVTLLFYKGDEALGHQEVIVMWLTPNLPPRKP